MAKLIEWHLIQYTPDMRRREPRNIGVAATDGEEWKVELFGVDARTGLVNGRALRRYGVLRDDYVQWADYYRSVIPTDGVDRVLRSQRLHPTEFRIIKGGHTEATTSFTDFVRDLYQSVVDDDDPGSPSANWAKELERKVESVLQVAEIHPEVDVHVPAKWGDQQDSIEFDYEFTNGQVHLMDRVQLHRRSLDEAKVIARDFNARVTAVRDAGSVSSFIAFYSQQAVDELGTDIVLAPLWRVAKTVDVDQMPTVAAEEVRHHMYA